MDLNGYVNINYIKELSKYISEEMKYTTWPIKSLCIDGKLPEKISRKNLLDLANGLFKHELNLLSKEADSKLRAVKKMPEKIKWVQESLLFAKIKESFPEDIVLSQGAPDFLELQRFDIQIPKKNIAIEFNGIQHYEPVDFFGGIEGFKETVRRDDKKRKLCLKNNVKLIEVKEGYDYDMLISVINGNEDLESEKHNIKIYS